MVVDFGTEPLFEYDGVRIFNEVDSVGTMTGRRISFPISAYDTETGKFDLSRLIIVDSAKLIIVKEKT